MTKKNHILLFTFSAVFLMGAAIPCICDMAISGKLTWSLISLLSVVFSWLIFIPIIAIGKKGIVWSLTSLSMFILPYLYILSDLVNTKSVFSIGAITAIISDVYLWIVFAVIKLIGAKKLQTYGIVSLSAIPYLLIMNFALSKLIAEPFIDIWDILTVFLLLIVSISFLIRGFVKNDTADIKNN